MARFPFLKPAPRDGGDAVVVIGLGRFGSSLALELMDQGVDVLGIDASEQRVQAHNARLTHVVQADSTSEQVLRDLSVHEFRRAVVAIGTDIEASILTASLLLELGVPELWAKAVSDAHGRILSQLGVGHVIYPEKDMGRRVAHLVRGRMQDFVEIGDDFALVRTVPRPEHRHRPIGGTDLRTRHGVTVVAAKNPRGEWRTVDGNTVLDDDDSILITGTVRAAEAYADEN